MKLFIKLYIKFFINNLIIKRLMMSEILKSILSHNQLKAISLIESGYLYEKGWWNSLNKEVLLI